MREHIPTADQPTPGDELRALLAERFGTVTDLARERAATPAELRRRRQAPNDQYRAAA